MRYIVPELIIVGYGRLQVYQIRCLRCKSQFFVPKRFSLFCEACLDTCTSAQLQRYIDPQKHLSPTKCVGTVVGWEQRSATDKRRSRRNYMKAYKRDHYTCQYCGYNPRNSEELRALWIDHIVPLSYGGGYKLDNLVVACDRCNQIAGNMVFDTFEDKKLYIREKLFGQKAS